MQIVEYMNFTNTLALQFKIKAYRMKIFNISYNGPINPKIFSGI
jgi:hypothetical protein